MPLHIIAPGKKIKGEVSVPLSKSESNRILLIKALAGFNFSSDVFSDAQDTVALKQLLQSKEGILNAGDGAATVRFLMAYCVYKEKQVIITGSENLCKRPMNDSVDLLKQLGADIQYTDRENYLPVKITPSKLVDAKNITAVSSQSSQHISAVMMIAPMLGNELTIHLSGESVSLPYIELTAQLMKAFVADVKVEPNKIIIGNSPYKNANVKSKGDWSAASYFYEMAALSESAEIRIKNLDLKSVQGDKRIADIMKAFSIDTQQSGNDIMVRKNKPADLTYFTDDFLQTPDLALTLAATCGGLNLTADLHGLKNLAIKESDRVAAFQRESYKLNIKTDFCDFSKLKIMEGSEIKPSKRILKTYHDHRIAMCIAPLSIIVEEIYLDDGDVVKKSFPAYWENLQALGFLIKQT